MRIYDTKIASIHNISDHDLMISVNVTSNDAIIGLKTDSYGINNDYEDGSPFDYVQLNIN